MLSKKNRITRKDFPAHSRQGFRVFSELFSGTVYPSSETGVRVSIVVSKKIAKLAVVRNRLRRIFYEAVKPYLKDISKGSLIVLYPKQGSVKADFKIIESELESSLKKAKVLVS